jgi:hypothetical protein
LKSGTPRSIALEIRALTDGLASAPAPVVGLLSVDAETTDVPVGWAGKRKSQVQRRVAVVFMLEILVPLRTS